MCINCENSFYIHCYFQSSGQPCGVGIIPPSAKKTMPRACNHSRSLSYRGLTLRCEARLSPPCKSTEPCTPFQSGPDTASSPLRTSQCGYIILNFQSTGQSPCIWMCFLNHCLDVALHFLFLLGATPGSPVTLAEGKRDSQCLANVLPNPSPSFPIPAFMWKAQSWSFWELQCKNLNYCQVGNYVHLRFLGLHHSSSFLHAWLPSMSPYRTVCCS